MPESVVGLYAARRRPRRRPLADHLWHVRDLRAWRRRRGVDAADDRSKLISAGR